jgi:hypothetical protein
LASQICASISGTLIDIFTTGGTLPVVWTLANVIIEKINTSTTILAWILPTIIKIGQNLNAPNLGV